MILPYKIVLKKPKAVKSIFHTINSLLYTSLFFFSSLLYMNHNLLGCTIALVAQSLNFTQP